MRFNDYYAGLTYKTFISEKNALDFTLNAEFDKGFGLTGLYEIHEPTGFAPRLNWYYGLGGHVSLWSGKYQSYGDFSTIGVGTVVTKDLPPYSNVIGNPMKVLDKKLKLI